MRSEMAEDSISSGPWASLYVHCNTLAYVKWHTHMCHDSYEANHKRPERWVAAQFLRIPTLPQNRWNNPPIHCSVTQSCLTLCNPMDCSTPGFPVLHHHPQFAQIHVHWVQWCHPAISSSHHLLLLPSVFASIRVFSNDSTLCIRWPKYWSFSFSFSPSNECSGLISFRTDWFDLAVQGTLKSLLQHHSLKASILQHSAFPTVQLSHPYMTTGKTIALTIQTFVDKLMSLLFNTLSRSVIAILPRSKPLLILWLQSPSTLILESKKMKSNTVSIFSPSICHCGAHKI